MEFVFVLSKYDDVLFRAQVSRALEKRTELSSRKALPKMWKSTDKINSIPKVKGDVLEKRHNRYKIYGIILLLLGFFLLIPGLMDPKELLVPLIAGALTVGTGIVALRCGRKHKRTNATAFDKAAIKLFQGYEIISPFEVKFTKEKIYLKETDTIDYSEIENIFITEDLLVLIWNERISVLQRKDLMTNNMEEFINFITEKSQNSFEIIHLI